MDITQDLLKSLDGDTLAKLLEAVKSYHDQNNQATQIREIVPVKKWLESEYYVGRDGQELYDAWKDVIVDVFEGDHSINEVIITGSLGIGKTTLAVFLMLRKIYELSCFSNIPLLFPNMMASSKIVFTYFMLTKKQAESTGYSQFRNTLDSIQYFRKEFPRNYDINSRLDWPNNNLSFIYGSSTDDFIGMNALGSILDEANFFKIGSSGATMQPDYSKVFNLYQTIINRSKSRFASHGKDHSLSVLVSSPTTENSFTQKRIESSEGDNSTYVVSAKPWEVKPKGTYSEKFFWVFSGTDTIEPNVVSSIEDLNMICEALGIEPFSNFVALDFAISKVPPDYKSLFTKVPEDFKKNFSTNIMRSLQDIAGVSVSPMGRLFTSRPVYNKAIVDYLRHPFTMPTFTIATGDNSRIQDYLIPGFRFKDPDKPHFIHIDQSTTSDATGIALCHIAKITNDGGVPKPIIEVDMMLKIYPPQQPKKISIAKVREFLFYLRDYMGVNIQKITYDRFASADSVQILAEGQFETDFLSVDRTDKQYMALVNLFYEDQIKLYDYKPFVDEFFSLIHYRERGKVDHPAQGSGKDISDAVTGAVFNALQYDLSTIYLYDGEYTNSFITANDQQQEDGDLFSLQDIADSYYDKRIFNTKQKFDLFS